MANAGTSAAVTAFFGMILNGVARVCIHGQSRIKAAGKACGLKADARVRVAVADDSRAASRGHFEECLREITVLPEFPDKPQRLLRRNFARVVFFAAMVQPESGSFPADADAGIDGPGRGIQGQLAGAVHYGNEVCLFKKNAVGVGERTNLKRQTSLP